MQLPRPLANLIDQVRTISKGKTVGDFGLSCTIITPNEHIVPIDVEQESINSDFFNERADISHISVRIQPGVYQNKVIPYKDNLVLEVINRQGLTATSKRYRATPQQDGDNYVQGAATKTIDMNNIDTQNLITVSFQLFEIGFDAIRNSTISQSFVSAKPDDVLHSVLTTQCQSLGLTGADAFKGVDIEKPIDNPRIYRQIMVRQGTRTVNLAQYLQKEEGVGIYSKGIGSFYRAGIWYVYPIVKQGRYDTSKYSLDIIRLPEDVVPTVDVSYYQSNKSTTILVTGEGNYLDNTDIVRQNEGAGNQIIATSAVSGETGMHYKDGRAVKTRQDTLTEYRTHQRGSGNERINLPAKATSNAFPMLSQSALNDVTYLEVEWHNSSHFLIQPNAPLKYYYMDKDQVLKVREGCCVGITTQIQPTTYGAGLRMRSYSTLKIFLFPLSSGELSPNN